MQFISPFTNKRTDEWGGSLEKRMRFAVRIVERARELVGDDFPITYRMSADEGVDGGYGLDEAVEIAAVLERAGVDAFSVSAGIYESMTRIFPPSSADRGANVTLARSIKQRVSVPVIVAGKLDDPDDAAGTIESGAADAIAIARGLLADPAWARRVRDGDTQAIRPCIYHNEGCLGDIFRGWALQCDVNPGVNRDGPARLPRTETPARIVVVGAGPAGCEVARAASLRGHDVVLIDRKDGIGGTLQVAGAPSFRRDFDRLIRYYEYELSHSTARIELGVRADPGAVASLGPEVVVVATGRSWGKHGLTTYTVLAGATPDAETVCILGGDQIACLAAWVLAEERGKRVTLATNGAAIGYDVGYLGRLELEEGLTKAGVTVTTEPPPGATAIAGEPAPPNVELAEQLDAASIKTIRIGDCAGGTRIFHAVRDGLQAALALP
jgi:NADPH-dependent 2,4-dienoyl-CoA reductase/sulfur reductase-like enzyme